MSAAPPATIHHYASLANKDTSTAQTLVLLTAKRAQLDVRPVHQQAQHAPTVFKDID